MNQTVSPGPRTGSVRKAAQLMNRNPSTISWQIRQLEQQLDLAEVKEQL